MLAPLFLFLMGVTAQNDIRQQVRAPVQKRDCNLQKEDRMFQDVNFTGGTKAHVRKYKSQSGCRTEVASILMRRTR